MTAYKVEELLALRDSASESAVSFIERFGDEGAIKEHVLRPSASAGVIGSILHRPRSIGMAQYLGAAKKPSPSPSVKRGKVERLIKEHGSPPGMRVTAGGRVVPSDLPPLNSPRFPFNGRPQVGTNRVTSAPQTSSSTTPPNASNMAYPYPGMAPYYMMVNGQPCFVYGGQCFPAPIFDPNTFAQHMAAMSMGDPAMAHAYSNPYFNGAAPAPYVNPLAVQLQAQPPIIPVVPPFSIAQQIAADGNMDLLAKHNWLNAEYEKSESLRKELERTEVIYEGSMGPAWKQRVIEAKRGFVTLANGIRELLKNLDADQTPVSSSLATNTFHYPLPQTRDVSTKASFEPLRETNRAAEKILAEYQHSTGSGIAKSTGTSSLNPGTPEDTKSVTANRVSPWKPKGRRSHAVEIKEPPKEQKHSSSLDPTSPTYTPGRQRLMRDDAVEVSPSSTTSPTKGNHAEEKDQKTLRHKSSAASVQTADFFPTNTHEHSGKLINGEQGNNNGPQKPNTPEKVVIVESKVQLVHSPCDENSHPAAPPVSPADAHGLPRLETNATISERVGILHTEMDLKRPRPDISTSSNGGSWKRRHLFASPSFADGWYAGLSEDVVRYYQNQGDGEFVHGFLQAYHHLGRQTPDLSQLSQQISMPSGPRLGNWTPASVGFQAREQLKTGPYAGRLTSLPLLSAQTTQGTFNSVDAGPARSFSIHTPTSINPSGPRERIYPAMRESAQPINTNLSHFNARRNQNGRVSQIDGPSDELVDLRSAPASPPKASESPKKSDSPAKAKLKQIANSLPGLGKKATDEDLARNDDPQSMNAGDKKRWREKWRKNFRDIKTKEQSEIDRYRTEHPGPQP